MMHRECCESDDRRADHVNAETGGQAGIAEKSTHRSRGTQRIQSKLWLLGAPSDLGVYPPCIPIFRASLCALESLSQFKTATASHPIDPDTGRCRTRLRRGTPVRTLA
jgi:hypothetical protein